MSTSLKTRLEALELEATPERTRRMFSTYDGATFVETTACLLDHRQGLIGANGVWPEFVKTITAAELDAIKQSHAVLVTTWEKAPDEQAI